MGRDSSSVMWRCGVLLVTGALLVAPPSPAAARDPSDRRELPEPIVAVSEAVATTVPLREIRPRPPRPAAGRMAFEPRRPVQGPPVRPGRQATGDPALQYQGSLAAAVPTTVNFDGMPNRNGVKPADAVMDIGPAHVVQVINMSMQVWDRSGKPLWGPSDINVLFQPLGGACAGNNDGDPSVLYDHLADRFILTQLARPNFPNGPFYQCVAVSRTGDPTGAWYLYAFIMSTSKLNDYPKIGVWPDAYYLSTNQFACNLFSCSWRGAGVAALERDRMLAGLTARMVYFDLYGVDDTLGGLLPSDLDGPPPPPGAPNWFAQVDDNAWGYSGDQVRILGFHVDWADTSRSTIAAASPEVIPVASFDSDLCSYNACIPQPGTAVRLDAMSDRLMHRLQYRNFGSHESLVVTHSVDTGGDHAGIRWYELRRSGGAWGTEQQGTYAPDATHRWMASAAMNGAGDIAMGYSAAGATTSPSIRMTGRLESDPPGLMTFDEGMIIAGTGSQTQAPGRWGDYASMSVDPVDDCTFWYTTEYMRATSGDGWQTRIASFRLADCAGCRNDADCDDGDACNGTETCGAEGCLPGEPPVCDDGDVCTVDVCDPASGCGSWMAAIGDAPGEVAGLILEHAPDAGVADLWWDADPLALWYEVYAASSPDLSDLACIGGGIETPSATDAGIPPPGSVRYLLVGGRNCSGGSELGAGIGAPPRPSATPCP